MSSPSGPQPDVNPADDLLARWQQQPPLAAPPAAEHAPPADLTRPTSWRWPVLLYVATCYTTTEAHGLAYAVPLMIILTCHEFGHYLQARRYRVPASLPYFIPMPGTILGTMGAVIAMRANMGNRRALFDIGISGPLAGLVPALIFSVVGLHWSTVVVEPPHQPGGTLGEPLLFQWLIAWIFGPLPEGTTVSLHALGLAGWVGIFITALNLFPIGQLDGGHVLYAILRRKAHFVASALLLGCIAVVLYSHSYQWLLMLMLLVLIGPNHPPTADDEQPLGTPRIVLGWVTLAFLIIGFTPTPIS
jgi:membrane-associated protease RseP (regulator of RpoE activity)